MRRNSELSVKAVSALIKAEDGVRFAALESDV